MEMLEKKAPRRARVPTKHHAGSGAIEHLCISLQQRRTLVVSILVVLILLSSEWLLFQIIFIDPIQFYRLLLSLTIDILLAVLIGWLTAEPLAISAYLRAIQREQKTNSRVYTTLTAVKNLDETPSHPSHQPGQKDIRAIAKEVPTHLLILGLPGAGKTMALRAAYQFPVFKRSWSLVRGRQSIPVYVPMKDYNAFLGEMSEAASQSLNTQNLLVGTPAYPESILAYLQADNGLVGLNHLRPYLKRLAERGRLLFLCDGLNEVDRNRLGYVCHELVSTMQGKLSRLAMTCRELDYREEKSMLHRLVGPDCAEVALILPLRLDQIESFVEQYRKYAPEQIGKQNKYSASEINQRIKQSRLSYNCTNPMMLVTLMKTIDELDNDALNVGTRGLLLSKYISRLVTAELQRQGNGLITEGDVVLFLSQLACIARRRKLRNAIQLGRAGAAGTARVMSIPELAAKLQLWLDEQALPETEGTEQYALQSQVQRGYSAQEIEQLTLFTQGVGLVTSSHHGVLSFRHELIAEYFVANYLHVIDGNPQGPIPFGNELVADIGAWSEPIAMWAGMSHNPMELAKRIANLAQSYPQHSYNALSLSLVCAGVRWGPQEKHPPPLPENVSQLLVTAVHDVKQRERLAERLKHSADEGGTEVYRALLPLIMEAHIDDLLLMLDKWTVSNLLFDYLRDAVETGMPHEQVQQLVSILGRFGEVAIPQAVKLSQAGPTNNLYLRIEALHVLAGTNTLLAVEPLIDNLKDTDDQVTNATVNALVQLGPTLALDAVLTELKNQVPRALVLAIHWAVLAVLRGFLSLHTLNNIQYKRIIGALLLATSSLYIPDVQAEAKRLLLQEAIPTGSQPDERWQRVVEMATRLLDERDETRTANLKELLQQIGMAATPMLLEELRRSRVECVKVNVVAVLGTVRDPDALLPLLPFLEDPSPLVNKQVSVTLRDYAPESIPPLIRMVLHHHNQKVAENASAILREIGAASVQRIIDALDRIVRNRTGFLVEVLVSIHDTRAVRPLISLLKRLSSETDVPLTIVVIQALGTFPEKQVVAPLLAVLTSGIAPFIEEVSRALSCFGEIAFPELIAALDVPEETASVRGIRNTLLNMQPFLAGQLLEALRNCSEAQTRQIELIFLQKDDTAPFLVSHISHPDGRVRTFVLSLLDKLEREQVTPPLLDALKNLGELEVIASFLLKYQECIPALVELLSDLQRNDAAGMVLLRFGIAVIPYLEPGLNHLNAEARHRASTILMQLVEQDREPQMQQKVIMHIVKLFAAVQREFYAWYALRDLLTDKFAEQSIPVLLQGLEDVELRDRCAEVLVRMVPKHKIILDELLAALRMRARMVGATEALVSLGTTAIEQVCKLVLDPNVTVAQKAQEILSRIGPAALPFVWENYRNAHNIELQEISRKIFSDMPTERIKDELIRLLISEDRLNIEMAMTLSVERILVEDRKPPPDQKMIAALLEYIQTHGRENTNLRALALLLLLPKDVVIGHLLPILYAEHQEWLAHIFLLLGPEGGQVEAVLWHILQSQDPAISHELRREAAAVMGFLGLDIGRYATSLNQHSPLLQSQPAGPITRDFQKIQQQHEELDVALRALGGLLAGGKWNSEKLLNLWDNSKEGSPTYELYSVLLGKQFSGQIQQLELDIRHMREEYKKQIKNEKNLNKTIYLKEAEIETLKQKQDELQKELRRLRQQQPPSSPY